MIDPEVIRLRRLRRAALRARAVARALCGVRGAVDDAVLVQAACASWRVARTASGWLRAQPCVVYQRDETLSAVIADALAGRIVAAGCTTRTRVLHKFSGCLNAFARELDDARALTRSTDLSERLGRSQVEVRALVRAVACARAPEARRTAVAPSSATAGGLGIVAGVAEWPYVEL